MEGKQWPHVLLYYRTNQRGGGCGIYFLSRMWGGVLVVLDFLNLLLFLSFLAYSLLSTRCFIFYPSIHFGCLSC